RQTSPKAPSPSFLTRVIESWFKSHAVRSTGRLRTAFEVAESGVLVELKKIDEIRYTNRPMPLDEFADALLVMALDVEGAARVLVNHEVANSAARLHADRQDDDA